MTVVVRPEPWKHLRAWQLYGRRGGRGSCGYGERGGQGGRGPVRPIRKLLWVVRFGEEVGWSCGEVKVKSIAELPHGSEMPP